MSLNSEEIKQHCTTILTDSRIRNKVVVLCEGDIPRIQGRLSPQAYRGMEKMPDSNFYNACVPNWWTQKRPRFFNCGSREDVLNAYFALRELHETDISHSYLDSARLFAIVDLDLQHRAISDYCFPDIESIFHHLYEKTGVKESHVPQHRIWVTGLIHKEAYFLLPQLQGIFDHSPVQPIYRSNNLVLENVYLDIADESAADADLQSCFQRACDRICHCSGLDFSAIDQLKDSWKMQFQAAQDYTKKEELIFALLTIRKAKAYWNQIEPSGDWTRPASTFRDQLLLEIGRFYAAQTDTAKYHIPSFFKNLYLFV